LDQQNAPEEKDQAEDEDYEDDNEFSPPKETPKDY